MIIILRPSILAVDWMCVCVCDLTVAVATLLLHEARFRESRENFRTNMNSDSVGRRSESVPPTVN